MIWTPERLWQIVSRYTPGTGGDNAPSLPSRTTVLTERRRVFCALMMMGGYEQKDIARLMPINEETGKPYDRTTVYHALSGVETLRRNDTSWKPFVFYGILDRVWSEWEGEAKS